MNTLMRAIRMGDPLPPQISLNASFVTWCISLWQLSLCPSVGADGPQPVREHGAVLVEIGQDVCQVALAKPGRANTFPLDPTEWGRTDFWGYFHTHPYADGTTGVALSFEDFQVIIQLGLPLCFVQSGGFLFLVVRTAQTPAHIPPQEKRDFEQLVRTYEASTGCWQTGILKANQEFCRRYHLAFYRGLIEGAWMRDLEIIRREEQLLGQQVRMVKG